MKHKRYMFYTLFILFIFACTPLLAGNYRNITSAEFETNSYGGMRWYIEDAFITKASPDMSLIFKAATNQRNNLLFQTNDDFSYYGSLGCIYNFGPVYSEFSYTLSSYPDDIVTHTLYADATKERAEYLTTPALKLVFTPDEFVIMPSFTYFNYSDPNYRFKGKLFGSYSWNTNMNGSLWVEGTYRSESAPIDLRLGGSIGTLYTSFDEDLRFEYYLLPGIDWPINDTTQLKYNLAWGAKQNSYATLRHNLVVDIRF